MRGQPPKLTRQQAMAIYRARALRRYYSCKALAERMGVSVHLVQTYGRRTPKRYMVA